MLKYQVCLAVQHLDIYTNRSEKKKKHFIPLSTLQKAEQKAFYEMDTKYKANWKLNITRSIFYM